MKWTFGIITDGQNHDRVKSVVDSILLQNINDEYEIILVGGQSLNNVIHIPFDETIKESWITRKKNLVFRTAKYDNIAIVHDYVAFQPNWYTNFAKFGEDWDVVVCRIENADGYRFRDWVTWLNDGSSDPGPNTIQFLDYCDYSMTKWQYVSGAAYCIKKPFALRFPLDEEKSWGQSEDVAFSLVARQKWNLKCNKESIFRFLKQKPDHPFSPERL